MATRWTPERRARQAEAIQRWKPWEKASGPVSLEGKLRSSRNADRGNPRAQLRYLRALLREQAKSLEAIRGI